jgi:predicted transcriptional regulator
MLFNARALEGIAAGEIDLAFRRWKRPTVKAGGTLRTRAGVIAIDAVEPTSERRIRAEEARRAGFASRAELLRSLRPQGRLYRIEFRRVGDDPRVALRQRAEIGESERAVLAARLERMDEARGEAWTRRLLKLIAEHPETLAADLAASLGMEKAPFKRDVRKLKELGLTESLMVGYRLSPRGRAYLEIR